MCAYHVLNIQKLVHGSVHERRTSLLNILLLISSRSPLTHFLQMQNACKERVCSQNMKGGILLHLFSYTFMPVAFGHIYCFFFSLPNNYGGAPNNNDRGMLCCSCGCDNQCLCRLRRDAMNILWEFRERRRKQKVLKMVLYTSTVRAHTFVPSFTSPLPK